MNPDLSQLKDIHLPADVSWWPIAPIWWVIIILIIATPFAVKQFFKWRRQRFITRALKQYQLIKNSYQEHQDSQIYCKDLSVYLRRCAMTLKPRTLTAAITGKEWLKLLDQMGQTREFSEGVGRVLISAPYRQDPVTEIDELEQLVTTWIKKAYRSNPGGKVHV